MAYLSDMNHRCDAGSFCEKEARVKLMSHRNEHLGSFCRKHGTERLRQEMRRETEQFAKAK